MIETDVNSIDRGGALDSLTAYEMDQAMQLIEAVRAISKERAPATEEELMNFPELISIRNSISPKTAKKIKRLIELEKHLRTSER